MTSFRILALTSITVADAGIYVTTCHSDSECGTTCGQTSHDSVAFNEGTFGTQCYCQDGSDDNLKYVCNVWDGLDAWECQDGRAPNCDTPCGQVVCVGGGDFGDAYTNAVVRSACPQHHPVNVKQCCEHKSADWCTCLWQWTADLNYVPYGNLGGHNGYGDGAWWGECGSELHSLKIAVNSDRAAELVKPFLKRGDWCAGNATSQAASKPNSAECNSRSETECDAGCVWCSASPQAGVSSKCYDEREAMVLTHIFSVEQGPGLFQCSIDLAV